LVVVVVLLLLLLLKGDEDKIVPPEQAVVMWEALKDKGLPTTLMMYEVSSGSAALLLKCGPQLTGSPVQAAEAHHNAMAVNGAEIQQILCNFRRNWTSFCSQPSTCLSLSRYGII
jgi:hypothetical protein